MSRTIRRLVKTMRSSSAAAGQFGLRGADPRAMREANLALVLNVIRGHGPLTRVALATRTGLSRTTVSSLINSLLAEGLVREGDSLRAAPGGGRRPILLHFNEAAGYVLGVDLGRTHYTLVITDLAANVIARQSGPCDTNLGPVGALPLLITAIRQFMASQQIAWDAIAGIGAGIPGTLDGSRRALIKPPLMPGWHGVDLRRILTRELHVPIYLGNDANYGALGESRFGAGGHVPELVYVKVGTGIGCGLVFDRRIYTGSHGFAGELGHVTIDENGSRCDCGNRGCLETVAAAPAIVADAVAGLSLRRNVSVSEREDVPAPRLAGRQQVDIADVVAEALTGDAASIAAIARAGELLGIALAGLVNLFNPSLIVLDGGVARAGELLLGSIRSSIAARSLAAAAETLRIERAVLGENAIALGAVAEVLDAAFAPATRTELGVSVRAHATVSVT